MTKENPLDRHIHLHSQEIIGSRWVRARRRIPARTFSRFLCGALLAMGVMGMLWFQWWR